MSESRDDSKIKNSNGGTKMNYEKEVKQVTEMLNVMGFNPILFAGLVETEITKNNGTTDAGFFRILMRMMCEEYLRLTEDAEY